MSYVRHAIERVSTLQQQVIVKYPFQIHLILWLNSNADFHYIVSTLDHQTKVKHDTSQLVTLNYKNIHMKN